MKVGNVYRIKLPERSKSYWVLWCWEQIEGELAEIEEDIDPNRIYAGKQQVSIVMLTGKQKGTRVRADDDWLVAE